MTIKNRYIKRAKISEAKFRLLIKYFVYDLEAKTIASLTGLNRNTVNRYLTLIRKRIAEFCEQQSPVQGEVEVDESFFGGKRIKGKRRLPNRNPDPLRVPESINQCWSADFMSDALWCGRRYRTFNVVDDFNREALMIDIDLNLPAQRVIRALERIAAWRGYPAKLRVDNGPELTSVYMAQWAEEHGVELEFIQPGKPTQNSFIERFNRTYREEVLSLYIFKTLSEVRQITESWLEEYNEIRPHESLGNLTPSEYLGDHIQPSASTYAWH